MARDPGPALPFLKQLLAAALLIVVSVGLWAGGGAALDWIGAGAQDGAERARRSRPATPVITAPVTMARDDLAVQLVGTGRAGRSITLRGEAEGRIVDLSLAAGAWFKSGDVLLRLDDKDQQLALSLAETRLAEAERVLSRYRRLEGTGASTAATLDDASTQAEIARLDVARAHEALSRRTLRAPFSGVSGFATVDVGDWLQSGGAVASFDDRSTIFVEVEMPEAVLSRLSIGQTVSAETPSYRARAFEGVVVGIDSRVDPVTRAARVRVGLDNDEDLLRPGASFIIRFDLPGEAYPVVPELALQFSRGELFVWRIREDKAERVAVSLVRRRAGAILVDAQLAPDDQLAVEGAQRLAEGRTVQVMSPATADDGS